MKTRFDCQGLMEHVVEVSSEDALRGLFCGGEADALLIGFCIIGELGEAMKGLLK